MTMINKDQGALLTIGEVADQLGLPTHILRYWETRFSALKPLTRAGNRRYYRPEDVALIHRINTLLNVQGFTIKGAEKALASGEGLDGAESPSHGQGQAEAKPTEAPHLASETVPSSSVSPDAMGAQRLAELKKIRNRLAQALVDSQV